MKKKYILMFVLFLCTKLTYAQLNVEPYLGEIRFFAGTFAPAGWAICDGSLLSISENETLYNLIGTTYGGDGVTTFALPDYRGRVGTGSSNNLPLARKDGVEAVTLTIANLPPHTHSGAIQVNSKKATANVPTAYSSIASPSITVNGITRDVLGYNDKAPNISLAPSITNSIGNNSSISVMQPFLVVNYIIALQGVYPSPN